MFIVLDAILQALDRKDKLDEIEKRLDAVIEIITHPRRPLRREDRVRMPEILGHEIVDWYRECKDTGTNRTTEDHRTGCQDVPF